MILYVNLYVFAVLWAEIIQEWQFLLDLVIMDEGTLQMVPRFQVMEIQRMGVDVPPVGMGVTQNEEDCVFEFRQVELGVTGGLPGAAVQEETEGTSG